MSLATRVVLWTSAILVVAGTVLTLVFEFRRGLGHLGWGEKILAALFHSVNLRTSGFNTVDLSLFASPALIPPAGTPPGRRPPLRPPAPR